MSGKILPRLMAAAKEFNIGRETLVEFLVGKNFNREDLNGNVKLSDEMYHALESQFRADKVAKNKADSIEIPKGLQGDRKKKASEAATEEANATSAEKPSVTEETLSTVTATAKSTQDSKDVWPSIDASKEKSESPAPAPTPAAPVVEKITTPVVEAAKPAEKTETPAAPEIKVSAPEKIAEPIVTTPKKEEPIAPPAPKVVEEVKKETVAPKPEATVSKPASAPSIAESKKEEKVESKSEEKPTAQIGGLKVVDKIDLSSIDSSTRPKKTFQKDNNKDSKNSPIENKNNFQKQQAKAEHKPQQNPVKHEATDQKKVAPKKVSTPIVHVTPETFQFKEEKKTVILHGNASDDKTAQTPEITKIQADRLTGPKILGKIELPVDNDTRPKNKNEKRKRKRIPLDNKGGNGNNNNTQQNQQSNNNNGSGNNNNGHNNNRPGGPRNNNGNNPNGGRNNNFNRNNNGGGNSNNNNNNNRRGGGRNDRNNNNNRRGGTRPEEATEIDQKKIQEKIRETQAKLAGNTGNNRSKAKAKHRRERRSAQEEIEQNMAAESRVLNVTEFITVSELANLMDVSFTDIISKCMGLGIMVSINQRLDAEVIELVAGEFGYTVSFIDLGEEEVEEVEEVDAEEDLEPRNPIVTIMGHVDHGKTSLLDYVRNANVVAGEAGGITQHIGAYVVTLQSGKKITFLDTPGHEAFTAMRARGAKVTDIAVIVIAADDAVMPQTKEAISHAQAAGVPMVFAINKIDKDGANPAKIYEQLAGMNILVEEWGGKFQSQEISAKKGLNVEELLEKVLLEAEILDLKANPNREATGSIIEASLDKGRGYVATVLVQNGTLRQGDTIVSGQHYGKIKAMFNERNQRITEAGPSFPAQILGLNGAPQAGEKFKIYTDEAEAKEVANKRSRIMREQGLRTRKHITLDEIGRRLALGSFKELNIIIKGDVDGSVEALSDSLQKLSTEEIVVNVIYKAVGQISESDVLLATASDAIIVGFNVRASSQAGRLAREEGVQIRSYSIIYNAIEEIKSAMEGMLEPKVEEVEAATVEIREVYKFDKVVVAGCYVQEGKIKRDHKIKVFRDGILVYPRQEGAYAELGSLKRYKDDVKEVAQAYECGLTVKNFLDMQVGDTIVSYQEEEVKRTL